MPPPIQFPQTDQEEHDQNFGVKKVSVFAADGLGSITRLGVNSFNIGAYDYIALSNYSGNNPQTITYKNGGASGTTIATLTIVYDGSGNILSVTKT